MAKYYDEIPMFLIAWILKQKVFWVASAPLTGDGLVNVSPKGVEGSFHVVSPTQVWYEDLSGSGIETISHIRENGRITILFNAFEGPARIARLFGKGRVYEFGTPEYEELLPPSKRRPGSRSVIMIDVFKVGTSCGFAVPIYTYKAPRHLLLDMSVTKEREDIEAESEHASSECPPLPEGGLKKYWLDHNVQSLDGLPGMLSAFESMKPFRKTEAIDFKKDDPKPEVHASAAAASEAKAYHGGILDEYINMKVFFGFTLGILASISFARFTDF